MIQADITNTDMVELRKTNKIEYLYQLFKKYPEFSEKHPTLLRKVAYEEDLSYLDTMLYNIEKIQKNKISQAEAEIQMGNEMACMYFKPL